MLLSDREREEQRIDSDPIPAAVTDTGCERELNEDRYAVIEGTSGVTWVVCDGMGGVSGGELAAQIAIEAMRRDLTLEPVGETEACLRHSISEANRIVVLRRQNQAFSQMGTTVVAALITGEEIVIGHVGDSRAYLVRDGAIQQLTKDHTYVQELVDRGDIKIEEALSHPQAHVLTRAIGAEASVRVDSSRFWIWPLQAGNISDYIVLCSDGLYSLVSEGEIASSVSTQSPQSACSQLVELAKTRGGFDNITLAVIPIGGELRKEPPVGWEGKSKKVSPVVTNNDSDPQPRSYLRLFIAIVVLSAMASLLVVLITFFALTQ